MSVQQQYIKPFSEDEYDQLAKDFEDNAVRIGFRLVYLSVLQCYSICICSCSVLTSIYLCLFCDTQCESAEHVLFHCVITHLCCVKSMN